MIFKSIQVNDVFIDENRTEGGYGNIEALAANIKEFGQITPIQVVELGCEHPHYRVIAGRRRIAAFKLLSEKDERFSEIQACVYGIDELHAAGKDAQTKILENVKTYKAHNDKLMSWQADDILRKSLPLVIGSRFTCEDCAFCPRRTRYGDATLFEELGNAQDFCLSDACYNKHWKEALDKALLDFEKQNEETFDSIIITDRDIKLPEEAGGKILCNGKEYTVATTSDVRVINGEYWREHFKDYLSNGIRIKCYGSPSFELCEYVTDEAKTKQLEEKEAKRKEEENSEREKIYSALPESMRAEAAREAEDKRGGYPVADEIIVAKACDVFACLSREDRVYKVFLCSAIAKELSSLSRFNCKNALGLIGIEVDSTYDTDAIYSKLMQFDILSLRAFQDNVSFAQCCNSWSKYNFNNIEKDTIVQRLTKAGIEFDVQAFKDKCVKEQYKDALAAYAQRSIPGEPDAFATEEDSEDEAVSYDMEEDSEEPEELEKTTGVTDLSECKTAANLMQEEAGKN